MNPNTEPPKSLRDRLFEVSDEKYKKFSASLMPGTKNIIGVRMPALRIIAKDIAKGDWRTFLNNADNDYLEEVMIQGMVIGYAKSEFDEILPFVKDYIPKITNWALCDSFCIGLKFAMKNREKMWEFINPYIISDKEYFIRFGVVMLICYYVDEKYLDRIFNLINKIKMDDYYVKMALAWLISECYIKFPDKTTTFLNNNNLDNLTYNKSLQKITESRKIKEETKKIIRSMKRKNMI